MQCAKLIMMDGWQIKKDYPFSIQQKELKMKNFKKGMTIKEVTLSILIVSIIAIAALIIFIGQYKTSTLEAQIKKTFSTLNNAESNARTMGTYWSSWGLRKDGTAGWDSINDEYDFYNNYLKPFTIKLKLKEMNGKLYAKFTDGTFMNITADECINFHVDINGRKGRGQYGKDKFIFDYCPQKLQETRHVEEIIPHGLKKNTTRTEAIQMCKKSKEYCGIIIYMDGWQVSKDYPVKL